MSQPIDQRLFELHYGAILKSLNELDDLMAARCHAASNADRAAGMAHYACLAMDDAINRTLEARTPAELAAEELLAALKRAGKLVVSELAHAGTMSTCGHRCAFEDLKTVIFDAIAKAEGTK